MKRVFPRAYSCALVVIGSIFSAVAQAALTPVLPSPGGEPDLTAVIDRYFGIEHVTRIDDARDQLWHNLGTVEVETLGKWAGFSQNFGFIDSNNRFTSLFKVNSNRDDRQTRFNVEDSGALFHFALDPSGAPLWSSSSADNSDGLDHMVTWQITGGDEAHLLGAYIIAWEDLTGAGDQDFNDLVLLVRNDIELAAVPLPAAVWLFVSGLSGFTLFARRNR